jgi:iron(III) transport system substrate-binding protein
MAGQEGQIRDAPLESASSVPRPPWPCVVAALLATSCARPAQGPSGRADLTVYAAQGAEITTPLLEAYERRHPGLRIDVIRAGTGEMLARVRAERENPIGDLLWGGALESYAANADLFEPVTLPDADRFHASDPSGRWHAFTTNVIHLVVNTERLREPPPGSFADLADPRWRRLGRIALSNPAGSGTGYTVVTALATLHGWEFVAALLRNCRLTESSDSMFKWVKDGETAAGFLFETTLRDYVAAGAPLRPVLASEGLITQTDGLGLIAGARHRTAALDLMAFLRGDESAAIVRTQVGRRPARRGVAPPEGLLDIAALPRVSVDPAWRERERKEILARFEAARAEAAR